MESAGVIHSNSRWTSKPTGRNVGSSIDSLKPTEGTPMAVKNPQPYHMVEKKTIYHLVLTNIAIENHHFHR